MTDAGDIAIPKKRGPGRPRKERPLSLDNDQQQEHPNLPSSATLEEILMSVEIPKKRGRPRKNPIPLNSQPVLPPPGPDLDAPAQLDAPELDAPAQLDDSGPDLDAPAQLDADDFSLLNNDAASTQSGGPEEAIAVKKKRGRPPKISSPPSPRAASSSPTQVEIEAMILLANTAVQEGMPDPPKLLHEVSSPLKEPPNSPTQAEMDELLFSDDGHVDDATVLDNDSTHMHQHQPEATIGQKKRTRLPLANTMKRPSSPVHELEQQQLNDDDVSDAPSAPPVKRGRKRGIRSLSECVCTWGEECARFRRFFDRIKEKEGECIFAGTVRPNIVGGERQANFLDAVDRHLSTSFDVRQRTSGRYVIAYHHFPVSVLEHVKKLSAKSFLMPVSNEVAVELGITSDPADEYQTHCEPDEYGRLRPVRRDDDSSDATETEDEEKQWVLAPCHEYQDVKAIVDEGIAREIEERIQEKREAKKKHQKQSDFEEQETSDAKVDKEKDARIAKLELEVAEKDARIVKLEEELEDAKESNQMLQTQLRIVVHQIKD